MRTLFLLIILVLAGCTSDRVIVDIAGVDEETYLEDLAECRAYKKQVPVAEEMAKGAAVGAAVGGLIGATAGDSRSAQRGAGTGAVYGATDKMIDSSEEKARVVKNCMRGRGYRILN